MLTRLKWTKWTLNQRIRWSRKKYGGQTVTIRFGYCYQLELFLHPRGPQVREDVLVYEAHYLNNTTLSEWLARHRLGGVLRGDEVYFNPKLPLVHLDGNRLNSKIENLCCFTKSKDYELWRHRIPELKVITGKQDLGLVVYHCKRYTRSALEEINKICCPRTVPDLALPDGPPYGLKKFAKGMTLAHDVPFYCKKPYERGDRYQRYEVWVMYSGKELRVGWASIAAQIVKLVKTNREVKLIRVIDRVKNSITCLHCDTVSYHKDHIANRYCRACNTCLDPTRKVVGLQRYNKSCIRSIMQKMRRLCDTIL